MDERTARAMLAVAVEPGTPQCNEELARFGAVETLARIRGGHGPLSRPALRRALAEVDLDAVLRRTAEVGGRLVIPGEPEYPGQLDDLDEPPLALWVRGPVDLRMSALRSVSIVGARAATAYGVAVARDLSAELGACGWCIVSGAAFGIDAAAHRGALSAGGSTIAVMACGFDWDYPKAHDMLLAQIADCGAVVSELPPGAQPLRHRFLTRNRLIAALTRGTVVVEAALRSGAMATANRALELGRPLMAVPGPVTAMSSAGCNRLLHEQSARAVSNHHEVVRLVTDGTAELAGEPAAQPHEQLPESVENVLAALRGHGARSLEEVADTVGIPPAAALSALGLAELAGMAVRTPLGWREVGHKAYVAR